MCERNDMSKLNTNGRISYPQYRLADLMLFLLIMCACEVINILAVSKWFSGQLFSVSVMMLVSLLVLVRWNFWAAIFPATGGLITCLLLGAKGIEAYIVYIIGNSFILFAWFLLKIGKEKLKKWYWLLLYVFIGYLLVAFGRTVIALCFNQDFVSCLVSYLGYGELLNFVFTFLVMFLLTRFNSMVVDQKQYLKEEAYKRDHANDDRGDRWDGYTELNEDDLKALVAMDEYDRAIGGQRRRIKDIPEEEPSETEELEALDGPIETKSGANEETNADEAE